MQHRPYIALPVEHAYRLRLLCINSSPHQQAQQQRRTKSNHLGSSLEN